MKKQTTTKESHVKNKTIEYKWQPTGKWEKSELDSKARAYKLNIQYAIANETKPTWYVNAVALGQSLMLQGFRPKDGGGYDCGQIMFSREALIRLLPLIEKHIKRTAKSKRKAKA